MNVDFVVQGLSLDVSVLEALLKRNRSSHGRALYYRRISMVLKSAKLYGLLEFCSRLESFRKECSQYQQQQKRQNKKRQREERWGEVEEVDETERNLRVNFSEFETNLIENFPEILSRIEYASVVLFTEINRGFFMPFCTVAVGALARIRALIMQLGCWGLALLKEIQMEEGALVFESRHNFESAIEQHYMEPNETKEDRAQRKKEERTLTLSSLGIHVKSKRPNNADSSNEVSNGETDPKDSLQSEPPVEMEDEQSLPVSASATTELSTDTGESVGISALSLHASIDDNPNMKAMKTDPVDQNLGMVQKLKNKKSSQSSTEKKKDKKRKGDRVPKEKKKKKKKTKQGDYFDDLFS